jgi:hypothetical protein
MLIMVTPSAKKVVKTIAIDASFFNGRMLLKPFDAKTAGETSKAGTQKHWPNIKRTKC